MRIAVLFLLFLLGACGGGTRSPFVRITADNGRVYYARWDMVLHSPAGGFLSFQDLVTKEPVRLKNGTYVAKQCPESEVDVRQREFIEDPTKKPVITDYEPE
jgi:hypothetical protein